MIIAICGNVGSGKTISAVRIMHRRDMQSFVNFAVKLPKTERIKKEYIITEEIKRVKKTGEPVKEKKVNWEFWNDYCSNHDGFDIVLDEVHNLVHSRMAMSKHNTLMTMWFSQIRKILGNSEKNHIFLISQRLNRIDIAFRDLIDTIIYCRKVELKTKVETKTARGKKKLNLTYIIQYVFKGEDCMDKYLMFRNNPRMARKGKVYTRYFFLANPFYKYYDSYQLINFGEDSYL